MDSILKDVKNHAMVRLAESYSLYLPESTAPHVYIAIYGYMYMHVP